MHRKSRLCFVIPLHSLNTCFCNVLDSRNDAALLNEAMVMLKFNHDNIMTLFGITVLDKRLAILQLFMHHGDLRSYLVEQKKVILIILSHFCVYFAFLV